MGLLKRDSRAPDTITQEPHPEVSQPVTTEQVAEMTTQANLNPKFTARTRQPPAPTQASLDAVMEAAKSFALTVIQFAIPTPERERIINEISDLAHRAIKLIDRGYLLPGEPDPSVDAAPLSDPIGKMPPNGS